MSVLRLASSPQILPEKPHTSGTSSSNNGSGVSNDGQYDGGGPMIQLTENRPPPAKRRNCSFKPRKFQEGQKHDWWFASTAIPLLAATLGPLANVLSIAALVSYWKQSVYVNGQFVGDFQGVPFRDPRWCYWLNVASLILGFVGNFFLLMNFTQRIRYIIALPMTIFFWYLATAFLIGITACMQIYTPPVRPYETYTQGFWYAVIAACIYLICSMILMINMLGYFLGRYPDTFALTEAQRTLILQTMMFFIWLAGGGAVFARIETDAGQQGWTFVDALYFCDVTILTVGFGDLYPTNDVGRGIVFPYSVGGIIMLGLVISSLHKFVSQIGEENLIQKHVEKERVRTMDRTVTNSLDLRRNEAVSARSISKFEISAPHRPNEYPRSAMGNTGHRSRRKTFGPMPHRTRQPKLILLREEKDRFDQMRNIQHSTARFKKWFALTLSVIAFGILWCVGAIVFWQCEKGAQDMTYFQALYFCYVSLLTIGYGDLSPKSNAGRAFFVVWSLIAVPTMTVLISDMGDTVISNFKNFIAYLGDFTVLPKEGIWRSFLDRNPWLLHWMQRRVEHHAAKKRLKRGFPTGPDPDSADADVEAEGENPPSPSIEGLAAEAEQDATSNPALDEAALSRKLALAIRRVANDLKLDPPKKYSYEEWVEFTRLIRFTTKSQEEVIAEEEDEGLVKWDWIGDDSPMVSKKGEAEFVLDRLCESLARYMRRKGEAKGQAMKNIECLEEKVEGLEEEARNVLSSGANGSGSS